jgi:hypothetical protein
MIREEPYAPPEASKIPFPLGGCRGVAKTLTPLTCPDELAISFVTHRNRLFGGRSA